MQPVVTMHLVVFTFSATYIVCIQRVAKMFLADSGLQHLAMCYSDAIMSFFVTKLYRLWNYTDYEIIQTMKLYRLWNYTDYGVQLDSCFVVSLFNCVCCVLCVGACHDNAHVWTIGQPLHLGKCCFLFFLLLMLEYTSIVLIEKYSFQVDL